MTLTTPGPLSGRRAQAASNDKRILEAARAVFTSDPDAPIAAVAERAGVGISALYRRYRSKEELLQRLATDGLQRYVDEVEAALADDGDLWHAFARFMHSAVEAGTGSVSVQFAGKFTPTEELYRLGARAHSLTQQIMERVKSAGEMREDIEVGDLYLLFEQLQAIHVQEAHRKSELRHRYLALLLDALRRSSAGAPLPGPAPSWEEIRSRYDR
jgi:AcrR family transcriptional regulator